MQKFYNRQIYYVAFTAKEKSVLYTLIAEKVNNTFFTLKQKIGRLILNGLLRFLPSKFEIGLVSRIKNIAVNQVHISPKTFFIARLAAENRMTITPQYPCNRKFYLGLTFDIDYKKDYNLLPLLVEDLEKQDFVATINVVTHADYKISASEISALQKKGFEIGLHGDTHNTALAFLPKRIIKSKVKRALDRLGFVPFGFRTPGLSYSRNIIEVLDELGFLYDSSLTTGIAMYKSLEFPYIFQHQGLNILEVPVFMQDYNFFVNDLFSEQEAIKIFERQIEEVAKINGVALINLHPMIISHKTFFWNKLIELMAAYKETAYISTIYDLLRV